MAKKSGALSGLTKEQIRTKLAEDFKSVPITKLPPEPNPQSRNGVNEGRFVSMAELYGKSRGGLEVHTVQLHAIN